MDNIRNCKIENEYYLYTSKKLIISNNIKKLDIEFALTTLNYIIYSFMKKMFSREFIEPK